MMFWKAGCNCFPDVWEKQTGNSKKNDGRTICRCDIIKQRILCVNSKFWEENEKRINFRNKTENLKSFKSFLSEREAYG